MTCTVWIAFNGDWWAAPMLYPGDALLPIPVLEGFQVDWKVISETDVDRYNLAYPGAYDSVVESILLEDHLVKWAGAFFCQRAQLGRGMKIELL